MKKLILIAAICMSTSNASLADTPYSETKRSGITLTTMTTGALAAGPWGAMVGLIASAFINDRIEASEDLEQRQAQRVDRDTPAPRDEWVAEVTTETQQETQQRQTLVLTHLQQALHFHTAGSQLTEGDRERLHELVNFLSANPDVDVRLDGYADPRGSDDFNLTLSGERAQSVANFLVKEGVAAERVVTYAHGESQSIAAQGDLQHYAQERVVKVELQNRNTAEVFSQLD
jgi:outer membrane protein OmpA-like peptidoglycan-associated protein